MRVVKLLTKKINLYSMNLPFLHCLAFSIKILIAKIFAVRKQNSIKPLKLTIFETFFCKSQKETFKIFCLLLWKNDCCPSCFPSTPKADINCLITGKSFNV